MKKDPPHFPLLLSRFTSIVPHSPPGLILFKRLPRPFRTAFSIQISPEPLVAVSPSFPGQRHKIRIKISITFIATILILAATFGAYQLYSRSQSYRLTTPTPTSTSQTKTPTNIATCTPLCSSSLIPNTQPVLFDPLNNSSDPNQWQTGTQGSATCSFAAGAYHIGASADSTGGECNTQAANLTFTNFVYQIKMTINQGLQGSGNDIGVAGPAFCGGNALKGSF